MKKCNTSENCPLNNWNGSKLVESVQHTVGDDDFQETGVVPEAVAAVPVPVSIDGVHVSEPLPALAVGASAAVVVLDGPVVALELLELLAALAEGPVVAERSHSLGQLAVHLLVASAVQLHLDLLVGHQHQELRHLANRPRDGLLRRHHGGWNITERRTTWNNSAANRIVVDWTPLV